MTAAAMIQFPAGDHQTPGYLARPDGDGPFPAVVVIQEWWGLVPHIKEVAERFAAAGLVALAPDLYYGQAASEPDEARKLSMALDRQRAVEEIAAAAAYLAGLPQVAPKKVGAVGWCMGGALSLSAAAQFGGAGDGAVGAAVCFYGRPLDPADTARLAVPVLGLYASEDHGIPVDAVRAFEEELVRHQVPHEIHIYEGAHHAFFNDTRPVYDPDAAADAWRRTLDWFGRYLV
jgi:carboxymethylenebutenolidase